MIVAARNWISDSGMTVYFNPAVPRFMASGGEPEFVPHVDQERAVDVRADIVGRALREHDLVHASKPGALRQVEAIVVVSPVKVERKLHDLIDWPRLKVPIGGWRARARPGCRSWLQNTSLGDSFVVEAFPFLGCATVTIGGAAVGDEVTEADSPLGAVLDHRDVAAVEEGRKPGARDAEEFGSAFGADGQVVRSDGHLAASLMSSRREAI
jgi:hypothetical protein